MDYQSIWHNKCYKVRFYIENLTFLLFWLLEFVTQVAACV